MHVLGDVHRRGRRRQQSSPQSVRVEQGMDGGERQTNIRRQGPPQWVSTEVKVACAARAQSRGEAEARYAYAVAVEGGAGPGLAINEASYLRDMLGASLMEQLMECGLVNDPPAIADLLDGEVTVENIAEYIGPDTAAFWGEAAWHRDRKLLMSLGVPQEAE